METTTLLWIVLLPLLGAGIIALGHKTISRPAVGWLGSLLVVGSFGLTLYAMNLLSQTGNVLTQPLFVWADTLPFAVSFGLMADSLTLWWLVVVTGVGFLIHLYSIGYMADDGSFARFFAKLNYFIFAMSFLVLADNFVGLLVGWANVGFASFLLIGFWNVKASARAAARKAFLMNTIGEIGMVVAVALIFREFGTASYSAVFDAVPGASAGMLTGISLLLLLGVVSKSAQLPMHTWLPDAMEGPTPVSALIHAATMVTAGIYLVIRAFPLFSVSPLAMETLLVVGSLSALLGALFATRQFDIKRILAYSTMSQLGYMLLAAGVGAYAASAFHFFTHAFFKALLFLGAGVVIHYLGGEQDIRKMGGIGRRFPFAYWTFLAGVLAIAGAPGFSGFFSKDEILGALWMQGRYGLWFVSVLTAGLTAYYMARLFALVFAGSPAMQSDQEPVATNGFMKAPVAVLAFLSVVAGLIAIPGISQVPTEYLAPVFARFGQQSVHAASIDMPVVFALIVAVVGFVIGIRMFGSTGQGRQRAHRSIGRHLGGPLANGLYLDILYMSFVGGVSRWSKEAALRIQSGYLRRYALVFFAGFAAFMFYFLLV